jgi:hypothetical protein
MPSSVRAVRIIRETGNPIARERARRGRAGRQYAESPACGSCRATPLAGHREKSSSISAACSQAHELLVTDDEQRRPADAGRWTAGGTLVVAAVYELTPLKDVCLGKCRSPLGSLLGSWRDGLSGALQMGARNGAWCVGCCWALMASLFALGS